MILSIFGCLVNNVDEIVQVVVSSMYVIEDKKDYLNGSITGSEDNTSQVISNTETIQSEVLFTYQHKNNQKHIR